MLKEELEMATSAIKLTTAEQEGLAQEETTWAGPWPGAAAAQLLEKWCFRVVINT